jgi:hypothetical protein
VQSQVQSNRAKDHGLEPLNLSQSKLSLLKVDLSQDFCHSTRTLTDTLTLWVCILLLFHRNDIGYLLVEMTECSL